MSVDLDSITALTRRAKRGSKSAIGTLLEMSRSRERTIRWWVAEAVTRTRCKAQSEILIKLAMDSSPIVRLTAVMGLRELNTTGAAAVFRRATNDADAMVRGEAIEGLAAARLPAATRVVLSGLEDGSEFVRVSAADCLTSIRLSGFALRRVMRIAAAEPSAIVQAHIWHSLHSLGVSEATGALERLYAGRSRAVRLYLGSKIPSLVKSRPKPKERNP